MKAIGGFFELEFGEFGSAFHSEADALWCGRACFNLILENLRPRLVYVPFYTCDTLLEPLKQQNIAFKFYEINDKLEIAEMPMLANGEILVYINYFGLQADYVQKLVEKYGAKLVVDNTQAFFTRKIGAEICSFNSARKFFGVPDGAYLYAPFEIPDLPKNEISDINYLVNRFLGKQETAYREFIEHEKTFSSALKLISEVSEKILASLSYEKIAEKRCENFAVYKDFFGTKNLLKFDRRKQIPFCYPLLTEKVPDKTGFYRQNIFLPTLWSEVLSRENKGFAFARLIAGNLLALPCDQRLTVADCLKVAKTIKKLL